MPEKIIITEEELKEIIKEAVSKALETAQYRALLNEWGKATDKNSYEADRLFSFVLNIYHKNTPTVDNDFYRIFEGEFPFKVYGVVIKVKFKVVSYKSYESYIRYLGTEETKIKLSFVEPNILNVGLNILGPNNFKWKAVGDIAHELGHLHQYVETHGGELPDSVEYNDEEVDKRQLYMYALDLIQNHNNEAYNKIGYLIYDSYRFEQTSVFEESYASMQQLKLPTDLCFRQTAAFQIQQRMEANYRFFKYNRNTPELIQIMHEIKQKLGITYGELNRGVYERKKRFNDGVKELKMKYEIWWRKNNK